MKATVKKVFAYPGRAFTKIGAVVEIDDEMGAQLIKSEHLEAAPDDAQVTVPEPETPKRNGRNGAAPSAKQAPEAPAAK
jgi:hypothetical protein